MRDPAVTQDAPTVDRAERHQAPNSERTGCRVLAPQVGCLPTGTSSEEAAMKDAPAEPTGTTTGPAELPTNPPNGRTAGVDWAKDDHVVAVVDSTGTAIDRFTVPHTGTLLSKLDHVNLIGVRDLVVEGPVLAIVMDLATGPDLRQELTHRGTLPPAEAVGVTAEVLSGLACVHAAGVVHRDVKPENVVLDQPEGQPRRARLTDFGVSRLLDTTGSSSRTSHTALVGTPSYMAPEQAQPGPVPPAADVYAAGCVLYELLCGVPPFTGSPLELIRQHGERQPGRIPGISDGLWGCLAVLLHKDPAHRPSAEQAAADLRALVPVLLGQPALPPRARSPW